jgi:alpha-galactosidase
MSWRVVDEIPAGPDTRVYAEGWQSWSPTTWYPADAVTLRSDQPWHHLMRLRPGVATPQTGLHAEGLLVVDPGDGEPAHGYGTVDASSNVASLRAFAHDGVMTVSANDEVECFGSADGGEAVLTAFADLVASHAGVGDLPPAPTVWCSWYRYFEQLHAEDIAENLAGLDEHELPVEVVQLDDGWSRGLGEDLAPSDGIPDLDQMVDTIHATGRRAGTWLAPFVVGADTSLVREHPDWLVGEAGLNWGQRLVGLDLTHPGVRDLLAAHLGRLRDLGVSYLKLDFLYAGAVTGPRHQAMTAVEAYRSGLALVREVVGPEVYLLGCGAPILPSVGLVDAMRVSPDTFHQGGQDGSRGLRGFMSLAARAWQHGRLWVNDPDCLVARPSYVLRQEWAQAIAMYGGLRSLSDRIAELDSWGIDCARRLLSQPPPPEPFPEETVRTGAASAGEALTAQLMDGRLG